MANKGMPGQVVALFIVGFAEYGVVWLGTDWEREIQKGIERNKAESLRQEQAYYGAFSTL